MLEHQLLGPLARGAHPRVDGLSDPIDQPFGMTDAMRLQLRAELGQGDPTGGPVVDLDIHRHRCVDIDLCSDRQ